MRMFFVFGLLFLSTLVVEVKPKTVMVKTEIGEFPVLAELPEFVKVAINLIPARVVPEGFGRLLEHVFVVTDAQAFSKALDRPASLIQSNLRTKMIYLVMDRGLKSGLNDPLQWALRSEQSWLQARMGLVEDEGLEGLFAVMFSHELAHFRVGEDEDVANIMTIDLLDDFVRRGLVSPRLGRQYRSQLTKQGPL